MNEEAPEGIAQRRRKALLEVAADLADSYSEKELLAILVASALLERPRR